MLLMLMGIFTLKVKYPKFKFNILFALKIIHYNHY